MKHRAYTKAIVGKNQLKVWLPVRFLGCRAAYGYQCSLYTTRHQRPALILENAMMANTTCTRFMEDTSSSRSSSWKGLYHRRHVSALSNRAGQGRYSCNNEIEGFVIPVAIAAYCSLEPVCRYR